MKTHYVIDTNVLIVASARDLGSMLAGTATPEDPALREEVRRWLEDFERSNSRLILDGEGRIYDEYCANLQFSDYGQQLLVYKWSTGAVNNVAVLYDDDGFGYLEEPLQSIVHDKSDRKWISAAIEANLTLGVTAIANAADTDWCGWEADLLKAGIEVEQILRSWCRALYEAKQRA